MTCHFQPGPLSPVLYRFCRHDLRSAWPYTAPAVALGASRFCTSGSLGEVGVGSARSAWVRLAGTAALLALAIVLCGPAAQAQPALGQQRDLPNKKTPIQFSA